MCTYKKLQIKISKIQQYNIQRTKTITYRILFGSVHINNCVGVQRYKYGMHHMKSFNAKTSNR